MTVSKRPPRSEIEAILFDRPKIRIKPLAREFQVGAVTMRTYLKRYGIKLHSKIVTEPMLRAALDEQPGITQVELAAYFGVVVSTIRVRMQRYGLQTLRTSRQDADRIRALVEAGADTPAALADALGVQARTALQWMQRLGLDAELRSAIRRQFPACIACTDPITSDELPWGGIGTLHYGCARHTLFQRVIVPAEWLDIIEVEDAVTWRTQKSVERRGVVKGVQDGVAHIVHGGQAYQVGLDRLTRIVVHPAFTSLCKAILESR